ncbi:hypothetical protein HDU85_004981 [Gaertneriomyces sp. JEL0708]|nr:hypothetical protein HDU85_004981 [Gaertneriomyces sp. JEL0708]
MPASKIGPGPLGTSEQEDVRRQHLNRELQNDMQRFLAAQAKENPRLRRLRRKSFEDPKVTSHQPFIQPKSSEVEREERPEVEPAREISADPRHDYRGWSAADVRGDVKPHPPPLMKLTTRSRYPVSSAPPADGRAYQPPYGYHMQSNPYPPWLGDPRMYHDRPLHADPRYMADQGYHDPRQGYGMYNPYMIPDGYRPHQVLPQYHSWRDEAPLQEHEDRRLTPPGAHRTPYEDAPREIQKFRAEPASAPLDRNDPRAKARAYAAELEKQMMEKRIAVERERNYRKAPDITPSAIPGPYQMSPIPGTYQMSQNAIATRSAPPIARSRNSHEQASAYQHRHSGPASVFPPNAEPEPSEQTAKHQYLRELDEQRRVKSEIMEKEKMLWREQDQKKELEMAQPNFWGGFGERAAGVSFSGRRGERSIGKSEEVPPTHPANHSMYPPKTAESERRTSIPRSTLDHDMRRLHEESSGGTDLKQDSARMSPMPFASQQEPLPPIGATEKRFIRNKRGTDQMEPWEKEQLLRKQQAQQEQQEALRRQMMERDAEKARLLAEKRAEEEREQARIAKEQEELRQRYAREAEEAKKKEEEAQRENDRKVAERKAEQERREQAFKEVQAVAEAEKKARRRQAAAEQSEQHPIAARPPVSPPLPAMRNMRDTSKSVEGPIQGVPAIRSSSPPIPTLRNRAPAHTAPQAIGDSQYTRGPPAASPPPTVRGPVSERARRVSPQSSAAMQSEAMPETQAVLQQLVAIQKELERDAHAIQLELQAPERSNSERNITQAAAPFGGRTQDNHSATQQKYVRGPSPRERIDSRAPFQEQLRDTNPLARSERRHNARLLTNVPAELGHGNHLKDNESSRARYEEPHASVNSDGALQSESRLVYFDTEMLQRMDAQAALGRPTVGDGSLSSKRRFTHATLYSGYGLKQRAL